MPLKISVNKEVAQDSESLGRYDMALSRYYYHYLLRAKDFLMENTSLTQDSDFRRPKPHDFVIEELHYSLINLGFSKEANKVKSLLVQLKRIRNNAEYQSDRTYSENSYRAIVRDSIDKIEILYKLCSIT